MRSVKNGSWSIAIDRTSKEGSVLIEAGLIIEQSVCEVKITVEFVIIEFHGDSIMRVLVHSPNETNEIEA